MLDVRVLMPVAKADRALAASKLWLDAGYGMVMYQDAGTAEFVKHTRVSTLIGPYHGFWRAINLMAQHAFDDGANLVLYAGDDMSPDAKKSPHEIGEQYLQKFPTGFGVMQPSGDPQGKDETGKSAAQRICGSPWWGREWNSRAYRGRGPVDGRYHSFYADESIYEVSKQLNLLWMRDDLVQYHKHWSWGWTPREQYHARNQTHWMNDKAIFDESKLNGFPEGAPL